MPLLDALIVVASAFLHASWNGLLKRQRDPDGAAVAILAVAAAVASAATGLSSGPSFRTSAGLAWSLGAGLCEAGYFVTLALAFRRAPFGVVYAIARGGALVAIWPVSVTWLGEAVTPAGVAGVGAVVSGLLLLGWERSEGTAAEGVAWALACAGFIAGYHLSFKAALTAGGEPASVFAVALVTALPVSVARLGRQARERTVAAVRARPVAVAAAGALCAASFLLFLVALARGGAGAAVTLRNTSVVFAFLLARGMGERPRPREIAGAAAVVAGAFLVGWPR